MLGSGRRLAPAPPANTIMEARAESVVIDWPWTCHTLNRRGVLDGSRHFPRAMLGRGAFRDAA
jgi:hypothetical protein